MPRWGITILAKTRSSPGMILIPHGSQSGGLRQSKFLKLDKIKNLTKKPRHKHGRLSHIIKIVAAATATKHASCFAVSAQQQKLAVLVAVAGANSNVDATEKNAVAECPQHQLDNCGAVYFYQKQQSATNLLRIANIRKMDVAGIKGQQLSSCCCCASNQHSLVSTGCYCSTASNSNTNYNY